MNDAKWFLQQIKKLDVFIESRLEDLARVKSLSVKVTATLDVNAMPGSGNHDKIGSAVEKIIAMEQEITKAIDTYIDKKRDIAEILDRLQDPDHRRVLQLRYFGIWNPEENTVHYPSWEEIAEKMHYSRQWVCKLHGHALQNLDKILKEASLVDRSLRS